MPEKQPFEQIPFGLPPIGPIIPPELQLENLNRNQRRKSTRSLDPAINKLGGKISIATRELRRTANLWNEANIHKSTTQRIFQGEPFVYDFASVRRGVPRLIDEINGLHSTGTYIPNQNLMDLLNGERLIFEDPINGVNLLDLERLNLPLGPVEIKTFNKMFRATKPGEWFRGSANHTLIRHMAIGLAAQRLARPEAQITIPENIRPLSDRLAAYFEYYTDFMLDTPEDWLDEMQFVRILDYVQKWVGIGLFAYIPARLGITPSSAVKVFEKRMLDSAKLVGFWHHIHDRRVWKPTLLAMRKSALNAHRKDNLPKDLIPYQYENQEADAEATRLLEEYFSDRVKDDLEEETEQESADNFKRRLNLYRDHIQNDIYKAVKGHRWNVVMPEDHTISEVVITSQNQDVLMMILKFRGNDTHLTLELNSEGRLFGIPAALASKKPWIGDLLITDILQEVLEEAHLKFPNVEPIKVERPVKDNILIFTPRPIQPVQEDGYTPPVREFPKTKKPGVLTPIQLYLRNEPQPPEVTKNVEPEIVARYSLSLKRIPFPTDTEVEEFILDTANHFAKNDGRMYRDVKAMVESLIENPYGPGVSKLLIGFKETVFVEGDNQPRRVPVWHFRPDRRIELEHPESSRLRVIYVHMPADEIRIMDILHHNEFDRRYGNS